MYTHTHHGFEQAGFGWTNGIVLWVASVYGQELVAPDCPDLLAQANTASSSGGGGSSNGAVGGRVAPTAIMTFVVSLVGALVITGTFA